MEPILCPEKYREITKDNRIERYKAADWLYILDEVNSAHMYLIVGETGALLFDTGFGFAPLWPLIRDVTDLPLTVVCSHGHDDHILGCWQFEEAWLGEEDYALCISNDNQEQRGKQIASRRQKTPNIDEVVDKDWYFAQTVSNCKFRFARDGECFNLGGLTLQVYSIPGHTRGSLGLYCPEKKALFSGDTMMKNHVLVYAQSLEISSAPQDFIRALTRLEKLEIETIWPAHGDTPADKSLLTDTRQMLIEMALHGDVEKDKRKGPGNSVFGKPGAISCSYHFKDLSIHYNPGHLEQVRAFMAEHDGAVE